MEAVSNAALKIHRKRNWHLQYVVYFCDAFITKLFCINTLLQQTEIFFHFFMLISFDYINLLLFYHLIRSPSVDKPELRDIPGKAVGWITDRKRF